MAATESSRKTFWKKAGNTKLPGRPQQVYRTSDPLPEQPVRPHSTHIPPQRSSAVRPRSKTFEEYEKETDDAWDDREEEFSESLPSDLELQQPEPLGEGGGEEGGAWRKRSNSKGKGKSDLVSFFTDVVKPKTSKSDSPRTRIRAFSEQKTPSPLSSDAHKSLASATNPRSHSPVDFYDPPDRETMRLQKFGKLLAGPNTDLDELRKLSWAGIPPPVRATTWQLLCVRLLADGYLPANIDRREETLQRKRQEYRNFIDQYYHTRSDSIHRDTFRQIHIDVPRMNPEIPLFQQKIVQECFERILYIWSMRHPASGYVQGINDLVTPFFIVFLSYYISGDKNPETFDLCKLPEETIRMIEADSFWCMQKVLEGIQDNYTLAQPGIQTKIMRLKDLIARLDGSLAAHLSKHSVEYIQFSFRWMNNLLMREFPLRCIIRLWDSYLSERNGFATFHVYVCAALLKWFSEDIRAHKDFQDIMVFIQNLPTAQWSNNEVELLLAESYKLKFMFADAPGHLNVRT